ncbi:MAG: hypothetical protein V1896_01240 [Candidatus Zambryskibacteria bacterium]
MPPQIENNVPPVNIEPKKKLSKRVWILISVCIILVLGAVSFWFFSPKTIMSCGSVLPITCQKCTCSQGIPFQGFPGTQCLFGKLSCDSEDLTKNSTASAITDQFTDWKTYTNTESRFEIKYPKEWEVEYVQNDLAFFATAESHSAEFILSDKSGLAAGMSIIATTTKQHVTLGKLDFLSYSAGLSNLGKILNYYKIYEVIRNEQSYIFLVYNLANEQLILKILSTLKFTK